MNTKSIIFLVTIWAAVYFINCNGTTLTIYYETLCPNVQVFMLNTLLPNYDTFKDCIEVVLVPYGLATTTRDPHTHEVKSIECQFGEEECWGNKIQACALDHIKDQHKVVPFCACFTGNGGDEGSFHNCAQKYEISEADTKAINEDCAKTQKGLNLLADLYDNVQAKQQPPVDETPTFAIDGKVVDWQKMENDFPPFICTFLKNCDKCSASSASTPPHVPPPP